MQDCNCPECFLDRWIYMIVCYPLSTPDEILISFRHFAGHRMSKERGAASTSRRYDFSVLHLSGISKWLDVCSAPAGIGGVSDVNKETSPRLRSLAPLYNSSHHPATIPYTSYRHYCGGRLPYRVCSDVGCSDGANDVGCIHVCMMLIVTIFRLGHVFVDRV